MLDWTKIDTVLLDMDGTLLDLNFDNHFWKEFVPLKFAEQQGISVDLAKQQLQPRFKSMEGKLEWYCLDYWSNALQLDIAGLKVEIAELIAVLPHVVEFLEKLRQSPRKVLLVTNAHQDSLGLKMEKTCLQPFFDDIISSHALGLPKEHPEFWPLLQQQIGFSKQSTLMIDDSLAVLHAARTFGLGYLCAVSKPDSKLPHRQIIEYPAIADFRELMLGL
ncbi:MAG: GMP/IMP nucleotidase [Methylococcaceae bacterium]|nr:GMP/IMP nucleotidase [Methylococcaceae bacterium]MDP2392985.1 GMP/IMP nucleotidase [Methylococcaceae bacterium]MDP3020469.1 GMP/IMP nucleotidase [Methylococcaceae bacterium]MDP3389832.1 GMP/IMP nucleotidase [Methylococcaceae bacterium]MDP3931062.1 GMP/IMP nucleotidase [Methylococcaceae bacterium]